MTAPRLLADLLDLRNAFQQSGMEAAWKKTVRTGLRKQVIKDLHDFYDFHRHYRTLLGRVSQNIIAGQYRPRPAEVARLEKSNGISRVVQLLAPEDAVVLQTLVEQLEPRIRAHQPTKCAFYSRSHETGNKPPSVEDIDDTFAYPWWMLWPEFQTRIYKFTAVFPYIVVTDIANYYDNISFAQLRNCIASIARFDERLLDLLMFVLEALVWRPDYLPISGLGLPQVDFDSPRLLAHAFLFEADRYLDDKTASNFVRWMDDIDFGVTSIDEGRLILRGLDDLLHTRGVRLNTGKTKILSAKEAAQYFWVQENRELNICKNALDLMGQSKAVQSYVTKIITKRFKRFVRQQRLGNWEKVLKRYFTFASKLRLPLLERLVPGLLHRNPALRDSCFRYYLSLGYSPRRFRTIINFLGSDQCMDDTSWFGAAELLVSWVIPARSKARKEILQFIKACRTSTPGAITGALWLLAKYGTSTDIESYIVRSAPSWSHSPFLSRQVAAVSVRLPLASRLGVRQRMSQNGLVEGLRVFDHLTELESLDHQDNAINSYLFHPPSPGFPYPLAKVLICLQLLSGRMQTTDKRSIQTRVLALTQDRDYQRLIGGVTV